MTSRIKEPIAKWRIPTQNPHLLRLKRLFRRRVIQTKVKIPTRKPKPSLTQSE
jgi:hypothetical protein